jgi:hypothetical protein
MNFRRHLVFALALLFLPSFASANAGIPMLVLAWPAHWLMFIPVVALEAELAVKWLGVDRRTSYKTTSLANLASSIVGVPVVWFLMLIPNFALAYGASLIPDGELQKWFWYLSMPLTSAWIGPTGSALYLYSSFVFLSIPLCIGSIIIERAIASRIMVGQSIDSVSSWVKRANGISYLLLVLACGGYLIWYKASAP